MTKIQRWISVLLVVVLLGMVVIVPVSAQTNAITVPISGTFTDAVGGTGTFVGTFDITRFARQGGDLVARGLLSGTITDSLGNVIGTVTDIPVTLPVSSIQATCDILNLELGPLDLDLLGLVIHLDQVVLDITAEQGPGNLLGNLLCAIAGLLDGSAPLSGIAQLLNRIIRILG